MDGKPVIGEGEFLPLDEFQLCKIRETIQLNK